MVSLQEVRPRLSSSFTAVSTRVELLTLPGCSNEVQNFLYLSRSFASSEITEGMFTRLSWQENLANFARDVDFQAGIEPSMVMDYAKNEFSPALQAVLA